MWLYRSRWPSQLAIRSAVGLADTCATPLALVVAVRGLKLNPEPVNVTVMPGTPAPVSSLTVTTRGLVNGVPYTVVSAPTSAGDDIGGPASDRLVKVSA